jgi:hypothetical protein
MMKMKSKSLLFTVLVTSLLLLTPLIGWLTQNKAGSVAVQDDNTISTASTLAWDTDGIIVSNANNSQNGQRIITDGDGGTIIVWWDNRAGISLDTDIYAQRLDANGTPLWGVNGTQILSAPAWQRFSEITSDDAGGVIIAWEDYRLSNNDIHVQRVSGGGFPVWSEVIVASNFAADEDPAICGDGTGGAYVVWRTLAGIYRIYIERIDANGFPHWGNNGTVLSNANSREPLIVSAGVDYAIVAWSDNRDGDYDVFAQRIKLMGTTGQGWTSDTVVVNATNDQYLRSIISDGANGAILVWSDQRIDADGDLYAQRVDSSGNLLWNTNGIPISVADYEQQSPQLVSDGSGGAIIAWEDRRNGADWNIFTQRVDSAGNVKWLVNGEAICVLQPSDQDDPSIVSDGAAGAIISWRDLRGGNKDIYAQYIDSNGNPQWTTNGIVVCDHSSDQEFVRMENDGQNGIVVSWLDYRGTPYDIYAQKIMFKVSTSGIPGFTLTITLIGLIALGTLLLRKKIL